MSITAIEVGTAYISILPSTSKLAPAIRKELGLIGKTSEEQGKKTGRRFGASMAAAAKVGTLALAAGIGAVVKSSVDLEAKFSQTMNVIGATTNAPAKKMKELQQLALDLGASTSFSASEASEAMLELAKAGLTPATIQAGALEGTLQLAAAGGTSLASAATIASNAMNTFNLEGNEMGKISAALAGGANASTASVESLGQALGQVGPGAKNAGLDLNETVGALAAFDNAGIKGSDAGTSLKTMLARLVPQTQKAATAMKKANLDFTNADGSFVSLTEMSAQLQKGLSGLSESARTTALNDIFGSDSSRAAAVLMEEGAAGIQKYIKATKDASAAQKAADARTSGTAGALERLGGAWETVRLRIGLAMGPAVVRAADLMAVVLDKVGDGVVIAADKIPALVAGFRDLSVWVKTNSQWLGPLVVGLTAFAAVVGIAPKVFLLVRAIRLFSMATTLATVAQWRMNVALLANPFVLIIAAVVALVAGLVWFFTQTKLGQKIVSVAWNGIKTAVGAVVDWFQGTVVPILAAVWDGIKAGAMGVWTAMQSVWEFMKSVWAGIVIAAKVAWTVLKVIFVALATAFILMWKWIKAVWSVTGAPIFRAISKAASATWSWLKDKVFKPMKLGFQLLALGFVLAYKRYILPAWNGIRKAAGAVWNWVNRNVIVPFKLGLMVWGAVFRLLWKRYVVPAFNGIKSVMASVWGWIKRNVIDNFVRGLKVVGGWFSWLWRKAIVPAWNGIKSAGKAAWDWISRSVFAPFKKGVDKVGDAFRSVAKGIKKAWDTIKKAAAGPVNFVIDEVYNKGIAKTWNSIAGKVGVPKLGMLDKVKGWATGGWTGNGSRLTPAGVVHADEFVVKKSSRRKFEARNPGVLDHINRTGEAPGFAGGGLVPGASDWWRRRGASLSEHPAFGGVSYGAHMPNSLHYSGNAIDLNYRGGNETAFFDRYIPAFQKAFPNMGTIWRSPGHYNHAHIDTGGYSLGMGAGGAKGGGGGGGIMGFLGGLISKGIDFMTGPLKDKVSSTMGNKGFKGMLGKGAIKLIDGASDFLSTLGGGGGAAPAGGDRGPVGSQVRKAAAGRGWDKGAEWNALDWLINKESGWNPNAANPTSSARGLFQKMTSIHGPVESTPGGQARWGLNYIAGRYGDPIAAMRFHQSHGYYANGGLVKAGLYDSGGMLQPNGIAVNRSGKPEGILTNAESRALKAGGSIRNARPRDDGPSRVQKRRERMIVQIGAKEFEAYVTDIAEDAIEAADDFAGTTGRMG